MGPTTRVDDAPTNQWAARPGVVRAIRGIAFAGPLLCSFAFVTLAGRAIPRPDGGWGSVGWWVLMVTASTGVLLWTERGFRRFAPVAALYKMSLVFPDQAPSRFRIALRTNTLRQLERSVDAREFAGQSTTVQEAAEELVSLAGTLNTHDRLTRGHTERVRAYTFMIGQELGLPERELQLLHWAGLVHDIGKIRVPPEILNKAGRPTEEEWAILSAHPTHGGELVEPLRPWLGTWADAASQHHERWDGNGYPAGLRGEEISLAGRIVAVADAYDVMTSVRSYKKAMPPEEARAELARCAGSQFDPKVVRAFLTISVGRLRMVMGPLSWLTNLPVLGSLPGAAAGSALATTGAAATVAAATVATVMSSGLVAPTTAPVAAARAATTVTLVGREDRPVTFGTDDVDGAPTLVGITRTPTGFSVDDATSTLRLVPDQDWNGSTTGRYQACWGDRCSEGDLRIELEAVGDAPATVDDVVDGTEDHALTVRPLDNDTDADGDPLTIASVSGSARVESAAGTTETVEVAVTVADGEVTITPPADTFGTLRIDYVAADPGGSGSTGTVVAAIGGVNDPPVARDDVTTAAAGTTATINVTANDGDVDGDPLEVAAVDSDWPGFSTDGTHVLYRAPDDAATGVTATYTTRDPSGATATATVEVTVVDDARPPVAVADLATMVEDGRPAVVDVLANDTDPDGPVSGHSVQVVGRPQLGAATGASGVVTYQPRPDAAGLDRFEVEHCDETGLCATSTLTVLISAVNDPPTVSIPAPVVVDEDSGPHAITGWITGVQPGGGPDERDQHVAVTVRTDRPDLFAAGPAVAPTGALLLTPAPDAHGTATLVVEVTDDGGRLAGGLDAAVPIAVRIVVDPVNDAPVTVADVGAVAEDDAGGVTVNLVTNDTDVEGDPLTILAVEQPSAFVGAVTGVGATSVTFVPATDFAGSANVTYVVTDGHGGSAVGRLDVAVIPEPDAPQAVADRYATLPGETLHVSGPGLLANDLDVDGDPIAVDPAPVAGPAHGSVTLGADGSLDYTPTGSWEGEDELTYRILDGGGLDDTATVSIRVDDGSTVERLYLGRDWPTLTMSTTPPAVIDPEPDVPGGDGNPGISVEPSSGAESQLGLLQVQSWTYTAPAGGLALAGPASVDLWSAIQSFELTLPADPVLRLYDCNALLTECTKFAETNHRFAPYSGGSPGWVLRSFAFADLSHTVAAGRRLRLRIWDRENEIWIALTGNRPSALVLTRANVAPSTVPDTATLREDSMAVLDVVANDVDPNLDPASVTVSTAPTHGTATATSDGRIVYVPDHDANGTDSFSYEVCDTAGACATGTAAVTITPVNDAPSFVAGGDVVASRAQGGGIVTGWASAISAGPPDEVAQSTVFTVTADDPGRFDAGPAISSDGTLAWTLSAAARTDPIPADVTITVTVADSGGTAHGGTDRSAPQVFSIRVKP